MEITPATVTAAAAQATAKSSDATATAPATDGAAPATDFQTFLTLLTTQLRNQDPLKPMESTEFVAQLASFSSVEQQIRSNDRLDRILEVLSGGSPAGLASWIGKEVRAPVKAAFDGRPVEIAVAPEPRADAAVLVVTNDFGQEVARRAVDPAASTLAWDGMDASGRSLPHGTYGFEVERFAEEEPLGRSPGNVFDRVTEVRINDGTPMLRLAGGGEVALDAIDALR
jgi:flagellar basal-body rod modification protein FlgD